MLALSVVTYSSKVLEVSGITVEWGVPIGAAEMLLHKRRVVSKVQKATIVEVFDRILSDFGF